jgi:hypothetical protein
MNKNEKFTIIIINSIKPYGYEVNNIIGLPRDFKFRLRYRKQWVHVNNVADLIDTDGLLILRVFQTGKLIPLRRIHIIKARMIGDIAYIEYLLCDWIALASSDTDRKEQLQKFQQLVSAAIGSIPNAPNVNMEWLVFSATDFAYDFRDSSIDDVNCWGNLIQELRNVEMFFDVDFFKIFNVYDERGKETKIEKGKGFILKNDTTYTLEVLQRTHTGKTGDSAVLANRFLRLRFDEEDFRGIEANHAILSKYDLFRFIFRANANRVPKNSFIILSVDPSERSISLQSETNNFEEPPQVLKIGPLPDIFMETKITRGHWKLIKMGLQFVFSLIFLAIYVAPDLFLSPENGKQTLVSKIALIIFILINSGPLSKVFEALASKAKIG